MSFSTFAAGLGLGLSLIVVIGAQNAYVLRQGLRREHVGPVVLVCSASDVALYVVGAAGFGTVAAATPWLIDWVRWLGAAFLIGYGLLAARRSIRPGGSGLRADDGGSAGSDAADGAAPAAGGDRAVAVAAPPAIRRARVAVLTALALTWLNPHVYLDTVFLAGSVAAAYGDERWIFVLGSSVASIAWFTGLGYGARALGRWLSSPRAWRALDGLIAAVMLTIGVSLVLP